MCNEAMKKWRVFIPVGAVEYLIFFLRKEISTKLKGSIFVKKNEMRSEEAFAQPGQPGDDCSDVFFSGLHESLTAVETSLEWQPTPQVQLKLHALNNFLRHADGSLIPVWSQLSTNADNVSSSTARYCKHKGAQVLGTVFEVIVPEQSKWLTQQVMEKYCHSTNSEVNTPEQT
ncbi:unnamed protein product [Porites evermanni]|uniref:Uncharacterized protein n=1 Tax=Porites evermanni TaxID=104178 RepID=A0ABN8LZ22_9CNID|nr:unnamed protein product [Porites evermanni]